MRALMCLGLLIVYGQASAFEGVSRLEWLGKSIQSTALPHKKKATVYVYAQPDCASCSLQLGALSALQKANPQLDVVLITERNNAEFQNYLSGFALRSVIYADTEGKSLKTLKIKYIPSIIYVNKSGIIEGFYEGTLTNAETQALGQALIAGKSVPKLSTPGAVGALAPNLPNVKWSASKNHLVVFHSVSCQFCTEQVPYLVKYAKEHPNVAVWIVIPGQVEAVRRQFTDASKNLNIISDDVEKGVTLQLYNSYRAQGTPTQILINQKGLITWRGAGFDAKLNNPFENGKLPLE